MRGKDFPHVSGRRQFLTRALPLGGLLCLGCKGLLAVPTVLEGGQAPGQKPKFLDSSGMTVEEVFKFCYGWAVPALQVLARETGREKFIGMLKKASAENGAKLVSAMAMDFPQRDMKAFAGLLQKMMGTPPFDKAFTYEFLESTDRVLEMKATECLPARMWLEMNAADLGYALECSGSDAMAKAFNPKMKATSLKNLMKGDGFCLERFTLVA